MFSKSAFGRVAASKLFRFNPNLKDEALKERHFWEVNKNLHPLNRSQYLRWETKMRKESIFMDKVEKMPIDQKYRIRKQMLTPRFIALILPLFVVVYVVFCYVRKALFGITPHDASVSIIRFLQLLPRAPNTSM